MIEHNLEGTFPGEIVDITFTEKNPNSNDWTIKIQSLTINAESRDFVYTFDEDGKIVSINVGTFK